MGKKRERKKIERERESQMTEESRIINENDESEKERGEKKEKKIFGSTNFSIPFF